MEAVKTEFNKFFGQLEKVDDQLSKATKSLYDLRNTRTDRMTRKLKRISTNKDVEDFEE